MKEKTDVKAAFAQLDEELASTLMHALAIGLEMVMVNDEAIEDMSCDHSFSKAELSVLSTLAGAISSSDGSDISIKNLKEFNEAVAEQKRIDSLWNQPQSL